MVLLVCGILHRQPAGMLGLLAGAFAAALMLGASVVLSGEAQSTADPASPRPEPLHSAATAFAIGVGMAVVAGLGSGLTALVTE